MGIDQTSMLNQCYKTLHITNNKKFEFLTSSLYLWCVLFRSHMMSGMTEDIRRWQAPDLSSSEYTSPSTALWPSFARLSRQLCSSLPDFSIPEEKPLSASLPVRRWCSVSVACILLFSFIISQRSASLLGCLLPLARGQKQLHQRPPSFHLEEWSFLILAHAL